MNGVRLAWIPPVLHAVTVTIVVVSATILALNHVIDAVALGTVYGAALGFSGGTLSNGGRRENGNGINGNGAH